MVWETYTQVGIAALTNLSLLPAIFYAYRRKQSFIFIITMMSLITSIGYHTCDAWENPPPSEKHLWKIPPKLLGMNAGSWHRLDNIYAILNVQSMFLFFADFKASTTNDTVRWFCLAVCLFFQELSPWNLLCTVIPILLAAFVMLLKFIFTQQLPNCDRANLILGSLACVIGIVFFQRGLDEDSDYLRLNHSVWHAMAGIATYFWYRCKVEIEHRNTAKIM